MRVLVIEDDPDIREGVADGLRNAGFAVDVAGDLDDAEMATDINDYDVIVADRMLPNGDSVEFVRALRQSGDVTPTLFLTARDAVSDRVEGFEAGGDDYLIKPFALDELVVRVRALSRRREPHAQSFVTVGDLEIDRSRAEVRRDGVLLPLTSKERCILVYLADRVGAVASRSELIEHCWDEAHDPMSNVVDVHLGSLRRKLGTPSPIRTVRGVGFVLEEEAGQ